MSYVLGYTVAHDVSARDWQMKRSFKGRSWELSITRSLGAGPALGPSACLTSSFAHTLGTHKTHRQNHHRGMIVSNKTLLREQLHMKEVIGVVSES